MKLIFTKSKLPLSKLIRWGLNEPASHFAIVFDNSIVFHSNLTGTHVDWYNHFKSSCEIAYELDYNLPLEAEESIYQSILNKNTGKSYDFGGFFYFIWRALLNKCFGFKFPEINKWSKEGKFLCTGLAAELPLEHFKGLETIKDTEMTSPYQIYLRLKNGKN